MHLIELADVTNFCARDKLTYAVADGRNYSVDYSISKLERKLDPKKFIGIHRATLSNIDWVEEVNSRFSGQGFVSLKDPQETRLPAA